MATERLPAITDEFDLDGERAISSAIPEAGDIESTEPRKSLSIRELVVLLGYELKEGQPLPQWAR
jgi:hypothetical protein